MQGEHKSRKAFRAITHFWADNHRFLSSMSLFNYSDGQSDVEVDLIAKKYVERGSSLALSCKHNVEAEKLYKVTWLKTGSKFFEFINGRQPPYRNFSVPGAEIDVSEEGLKLIVKECISKQTFSLSSVREVQPAWSDVKAYRLWCSWSVLLWSVPRVANFHKSIKRGTSSRHS